MSRRTLGTTVAVATMLTAGGLSHAAGEHPRATCSHRVNDVEGDGKYTLSTTGNVRDPRDQSVDAIDITSVTLRSAPDAFEAHLKVKGMTAGFGTGETAYRYDVSFKNADGATILFQAMRTNPTWDPTPAKATGAAQYPLGQYTVGSTITKFENVTADVDTATGWVVVTVPAVQFAKAFSTPVADGTTLTGVTGATFAYIPGTGAAAIRPADTASATDAVQSTYTVGDDYCFGPPPASLSTTLTTPKVQFGDTVPLSATLVSETGEPLAGRPVQFAVAGGPVRTGTTDANGLAAVSYLPGRAAGTYPLVITFAGDATDGRATLRGPSVTILVEGTGLAALKSARNGTARTVTTTLTDDDAHAVAGQPVEWWANGKRVATTTTDAHGKATYAKAAAGQSVVAKYPGLTGKYAAATTKALKV